MQVSIERAAYNDRRYERPWIGIVTAWPVGKQPTMRWGVYIGQGGAAGVLEIDAERHDIVRWGQKDKRNPHNESRWGVVQADGQVRELKTASEARKLWRELRGPRGGRRKGVALDDISAASPQQTGQQVVEIPNEVMAHVQQLTEANAGMMSEIIRVRTALVNEGHAHGCNLVTGTDEAVCNCPASTGAGLVSPEQMAGRYGRLMVRVEQAAVLEQQLRDLFSVPEGAPLLQFCVALVRDIRNMNQALQEAVAAQTGKVPDDAQN